MAYRKIEDFTNNIYVIEVHGIVKETEKAVLVAIDNKNYWIPKANCRIGKSKSKTKDGKHKRYLLALPTWYNGDILAMAHNGDYINNVVIYNKNEIFKQPK